MRLVQRIGTAMRKSRARHAATARPSRRYRDLRYRTRTSWSRSRRVVAKAEHLAKGSNPRLIVTSLHGTAAGAQHLYERLYCARGDMENRIKEQQLDRFAGRTSCHRWWPNQYRLLLCAFSDVLMHAVRRIQVLLSSTCPHPDLFALATARLAPG